MSHVHPFQRTADMLTALGNRHSPICEQQLCILVNSQIGGQVERFESEPNLPIPNLGALARVQRSLGLAP